ncbi:MAG: hypothetical protein Q4E64_02845 [Phascolarctobacterium sp.]|uniref:hypothetical protein n=1 Tax=Phascolarctobacterium sp. TaxID=2049039 RepID=UPI0026DAF86D|nr:hypothetical protein [Phascolarctobacterium sp.]MDO4920751.1 hypothetical protein [Phascolarctobacterium sp.]
MIEIFFGFTSHPPHELTDPSSRQIYNHNHSRAACWDTTYPKAETNKQRLQHHHDHKSEKRGVQYVQSERFICGKRDKEGRQQGVHFNHRLQITVTNLYKGSFDINEISDITLLTPKSVFELSLN